jgi:hypothetical protein
MTPKFSKSFLPTVSRQVRGTREMKLACLAAIAALFAVDSFAADTPVQPAAKGNEAAAITPNEIEGSGSERINRAIEAAAAVAAGGRVVIPRVNIRRSWNGSDPLSLDD